MTLHHGDCIEVMATLPEASVDAIVTDPPYLLRFMGKSWDSTVGFYQAVGKGGRHDGGHDNWQPNLMAEWHRHWAEAAYRVAKPSAYLLAFGGTRTVHRMTCAIEDAGWIIRDCLVWAYASGFPKSRALLKPAWEPIVMASKPGPLRPLAIDECRIPADDKAPFSVGNSKGFGNTYAGDEYSRAMRTTPDPDPSGRWPANVILTDSIFDGDTPGVVGGGESNSGFMAHTVVRNGRAVYGPDAHDGYTTMETYGDSGTYSRFFLIPKADRAEREPTTYEGRADGSLAGAEVRRRNVHPTVKPLELMRHLVRLVTPSGGVVLDPFLGSGTTALAATLEGFEWIGIEREAEYIAIAEARLNGTQQGMGLVG